jgi:hypothetical protein
MEGVSGKLLLYSRLGVSLKFHVEFVGRSFAGVVGIRTYAWFILFSGMKIIPETFDY